MESESKRTLKWHIVAILNEIQAWFWRRQRTVAGLQGVIDELCMRLAYRWGLGGRDFPHYVRSEDDE